MESGKVFAVSFGTDAFNGGIKSKIRPAGRCLKSTGFKPRDRVLVTRKDLEQSIYVVKVSPNAIEKQRGIQAEHALSGYAQFINASIGRRYLKWRERVSSLQAIGSLDIA